MKEGSSATNKTSGWKGTGRRTIGQKKNYYYYRVGSNNICNRMSLLNGKLPLSSVDKGFDSYKVLCMQILLRT